MEREGLTGPKAAERLDVRHQSVYQWLAGRCIPPTRQAIRLAERMRRPEVVEVCARERAARRKAKAKTSRAVGGAA